MAWFTFTCFLFFWILLPSSTLAQMHGMDASSCVDMRPKLHGYGDSQPQMDPAPFTVTLDKTNLAANEQLSITLAVQPGGAVDSFEGFLIQVRQVGGTGPALGKFDQNRDGSTKLLNCIFGSSTLSSSAITHNINKKKTTVTVKWTPPRNSENAKYEVYYTAVQKKDTFWPKVAHPQIITVTASSNDNLGVNVRYTLVLKLRRIYANCGTAKYGCFGVPEPCIAKFDHTSASPLLCDMMVSWSKEDQIQNDFKIVSKMIGHEGGGYVALGLSDDNQMGDDSVAGCIFPADGSRPEVRRYYNTPDKSNELYMNGKYGVHAYEATNIDGLIFCGFTQSDHKIYDHVIDFNNKYFLMLARGTTFTEKGLGVHPRIEDRAMTNTAIRITQDYFVVESKPEANELVYLHGSIMLFTWFVIAPTGAFTARYYKLTKVDHLICGRAFWYTTHVIWMVATAALTLIAAIMIFARKEWQFDKKYYHNIWGLVLNVTLFFQVVLAFLWPHANENYRNMFKWIHFIVAVFVNCTAITCIFLVRDIRLANIESKHSFRGRLWNALCIIVVVLQVLMHLIMTYHTYWADGEMNVHEELQCRALTPGPLNSNGLFTEQPGKRFRYLMLLAYVILSVITVIVLIFVIYT